MGHDLLDVCAMGNRRASVQPSAEPRKRGRPHRQSESGRVLPLQTYMKETKSLSKRARSDMGPQYMCECVGACRVGRTAV